MIACTVGIGPLGTNLAETAALVAKKRPETSLGLSKCEHMCILEAQKQLVSNGSL